MDKWNIGDCALCIDDFWTNLRLERVTGGPVKGCQYIVTDVVHRKTDWGPIDFLGLVGHDRKWDSRMFQKAPPGKEVESKRKTALDISAKRGYKEPCGIS